MFCLGGWRYALPSNSARLLSIEASGYRGIGVYAFYFFPPRTVDAGVIAHSAVVTMSVVDTTAERA